MKFNFSYALYLLLLLTIVTIGVVQPFSSYSPRNIFPFFNWSLFDNTRPVISDYMARVTCRSDRIVETDPPIFSLEDNKCLNFTSGMNVREMNQIFQSLVQDHLTDNRPSEDFKNELEKFLELSDYEKVVIYKRVYEPKEYYLKKKFKLKEKLIEIQRI